ncbi:histidine--tRNA ligase [Vagococcus zengguangii]|uniref:Histidine--tRNA ligase n=1 Tax=Vagococcus zengguangii TaxID=2571750 RepID=A0A4D7CX50_9ENTE|nr:histidine--tRNA ligase [Vagococcus zengguangii]QCI86961.1 histidine--tRNA ligase [Vagococcus zengguangii]TLG80996.1 histidine--tRNA ligase [Vagococcus zengguangii]
MSSYQRPRGTSDILPGEVEKWQFVEGKAREIFKNYQFHEIRTPMFEHYEVISRSVGDTTDIVSKEMYDFYDKGERHVTLRPEGTAPVVRAFVENKLYGPEFQKPYKTYYIGPMFRYERPKTGRLRQFHQIGVEVFGSKNPATDVEVMMMALDFYREIGLKELKLVINSLGDKESRANYRQGLIDYLTPFYEELSQDSKNRFEKNPLRILDSKDKKDIEIVKNAPSILDHLTENSQKHFDTVKEMLDVMNVKYEIDHRMVRGLDYYNDTIFEIMSESKVFDAPIAVGGGGRYSGLVEELGGPETPGFGFGLGIERTLLAINAEGGEMPIAQPLDVYIVGLGEETNVETLKLVQTIRQANFSAERDFLSRGAKAQFKTANRLNAKLVMTLGGNELEQQVVQVKNMAEGIEKTIPLADVYNDFAKVYQEMMAN